MKECDVFVKTKALDERISWNLVIKLFLFLPFYILMITLPIYTLNDLEGNKTQVGLIVTLFLIAAVIIRPFTGKLLDIFGKREMLYFS